MAGPAAILREIHRLRAYAAELTSRIDLAPKQVKAQQSVIAKREEELKEGHESVKKLKVNIHEREVSVKAEQQLIKKYEQQINDIHSKKEYDALRHEIAGVQEKIRSLEDDTLTAMLELEEFQKTLPPLEEAVKKAKAEFGVFERDQQMRLSEWARERDQATAQIAAEETKLPNDIRPQYDRIVKAMGANALAALDGRNCTACYTDVTPQMYHDVLTQQFVMCRNCGRVLYAK
jgi:uncharacterized protein